MKRVGSNFEKKALKNKARKQRKLSDDEECLTRIESGVDSERQGNRTIEEEKMVRMLDNIVDELKPYYFFNQKKS